MENLSAGIRKHWLLWVFRGSACLYLTAVIFLLFVLVHLADGSWMVRFEYWQSNELLVMVSWLFSLFAILSTAAIFTILLFALDRHFRVILQWAWFIQLIGSVALLIHVLIQMLVYPPLMEAAWETTNPSIFRYLDNWEQLLVPVASVFVPSCWAISGLIYTAVMFRTRNFSHHFKWWSLAVWGMVLTGAIIFRWVGVFATFWQGAAVLLFIPWVWFVAEDLKPLFRNANGIKER
ncbi:MAG: hypothetical protein WB502_12380 [Thermoactinomyces sp.]